MFSFRLHPCTCEIYPIKWTALFYATKFKFSINPGKCSTISFNRSPHMDLFWELLTLEYGKCSVVQRYNIRGKITITSFWSRILQEFWMRFSWIYSYNTPVTATARSNAWTVFAHSDAGVVGLNHTEGMDICHYSLFVLGRTLATGWSLVQGFLPSVKND
jgi:hypothetical protein